MIKTTKEVLEDTAKKIDDIMCGKAFKLKTGSIFLDKYTDGLEPGSLNVIAARPGNGKTSFAIDMINNFKEKGIFYSLEMNEWEIGRKIISRKNGISATNLFDKFWIQKNYDKILELGQKSVKNNLMEFNCSTKITPDLIFKECKDKYYKIIVIDYLQILSLGKKAESKIIEVGKISQELKFIAKELNVPIVVLSQLGRGADVDKMPGLADLRWSGEIEENAHKIIFLHYPYKYDKKKEKNKMIILLAKNRSGEGGTYTDFHIDYSTSTFTEWTKEHEKQSFIPNSKPVINQEWLDK